MIASCGSPSDGDAIGEGPPATVASALGCGAPPPPQPCGSWRCIPGDESYELDPYPAGTSCDGSNICDGSGSCVAPLTTPAINNIFMYSPTQTAFDETCAGGPVTTTTVLQVSIDSSPFWDTLPDTCTYFGSGRRYDSFNIRPGQSRCYAISASNAYGSVSGTTRCFTTPEDLVAPTPPTGSVRPWVGSAIIQIEDRSTNETELRVYGRRAHQNEAWQRLCTIDRYNDDHRVGYPHAGTGASYDCGMDNLTLGVDYEAMLEAYHDRAERTSSTILPVFQSLPPIPGGPGGLRTLSKTNASVSIRWDESQYATSYRIYRSAPGGGAVSPIATIAGTSYTATGLAASTFYCFEVAALDVTGEGERFSNDCETTYANPPAQLARALTLFPTINTGTGQVFNRGGLGANGILDFLEFRAEDNPASFAGIITSKGVAYDDNADLGAEDCKLSAPGAVFVDADGTLQGPKLAAIYGSEHPFLREVTKFIGGCPLFTSTQTPAPGLKIVVHYTGYDP
jgi:hypothetical protein